MLLNLSIVDGWEFSDRFEDDGTGFVAMVGT